MSGKADTGRVEVAEQRLEEHWEQLAGQRVPPVTADEQPRSSAFEVRHQRLQQPTAAELPVVNIQQLDPLAVVYFTTVKKKTKQKSYHFFHFDYGLNDYNLIKFLPDIRHIQLIDS